jgi:hypothetical protein
MNAHKRADTDWFLQAKWGVMLHYLAGMPSFESEAKLSAEQWNRQVDGFDVAATVEILKELRAGYLIFTIGQNSGFFCSPNETYDRIVGVTPSRLSRRDLLGEMAAACADAGISLIAYLPTHGPAAHPEAMETLGFTPDWDPSSWGLKPGNYQTRQAMDERLSVAQRNWESIIREWSIRWGATVRGWWLDGCYYADRMYRHDDEPNFASFAAALKSGNPDSIIAFNSGVLRMVKPTSEFDDYTAGEVNEMPTPNKFYNLSRFIDGAQFHLLSFLGTFWRDGAPRYPDALAVEYTKYINSLGGVMSWDVPIDEAGKIPDAFIEQLRTIGKSRESYSPLR